MNRAGAVTQVHVVSYDAKKTVIIVRREVSINIEFRITEFIVGALALPDDGLYIVSTLLGCSIICCTGQSAGNGGVGKQGLLEPRGDDGKNVS
jgi:hypothetical protein